MGIKGRADMIDGLNIAGQMLDMQPVMVCAELAADGTMKAPVGTVVKAQLFSIVQTTADPVTVIASIATWLDIPVHELPQYKLHVAVLQDDAGDMTFADMVLINLGVIGVHAQRYRLTGCTESLNGAREDVMMYPSAACDLLSADAASWAAAETFNYYVYVEAIYQPKGV